MRLEAVERTEQQIFDDLDALCSSRGYIHALAYFSYRDNFIYFDSELTSKDVEASYASARLIRTEFTTLMGLMIKHPIDFELPSPSELQEIIDQTERLLEELHKCLNRPIFEFLMRKTQAILTDESLEKEDPFTRADVLREPIFYGGDSAYSFQYRDLALKRYTKDAKWLLDNKGFTIDHGCKLASGLWRLQNRKLSDAIYEMRDLDMARWTLLPAFIFSIDELAKEAGVEIAETTAFLAALTPPEAPANEYFTSLGDFNLANSSPIIRAPNDRYVSFQTYAIVEALYDSPFYWMAADKAYRDTAFKHRGAFTEGFVNDRMEEIFGRSNAHQGVKIYDRSVSIAEIDVLIFFADRAVIFQCKSKKLTLEARKGNDLQLRDDFKKSVQNAYDQGILCAKSLDNPSFKFVKEDGLNIDIPELREIYIVCVVSDHYPALTVQANKFLKFESDGRIQPPLVSDVFLIDVLAEMLPSPLRFLSYINRRVNYGNRVTSISEMTILAFHLKQNLWVDNETDVLVLDDNVSIDLDTAMTVRREGLKGNKTPDGILTRMDGTVIGRLLRSIENCPQPALVDLGFLLLKLSSQAIEDIESGINQIAQLNRLDSKLHDFTIGFSDIGSGITFYYCSLLDKAVEERLRRHCMLRKYAQQANNWFGLVMTVQDGFPKVGLNLRFPWEQDEAMDEATKELPTGRSFVREESIIKPSKNGRNAPCPCGSRKKFKKCCLVKK